MRTINLCQTTVLVIPLLMIISGANVRAQTSAQARVDTLRSQLEEVLAKQLDLQYRLQYLDEQLKAENIEKSLAGIGSTHPEDLRAFRRRQLETEKRGVEKELNLLAESRTRLETGIGQADADAYHQSAKSLIGNSETVISQPIGASSRQRPRRAMRNKVRMRRARGE